MSQSVPSARGTLAATPFAHVLIYVLDRRLTGSIVLEDPSHDRHAFYAVDGAPVRARAASGVALLGELVRERGIDATEIDAALADAEGSGRRLGEVLLERGALDAGVLEALLGEQVTRRLEHFAALPKETAYGYYAGTNFLERVGGPQGSPSALAAIWRVLRQGVDPSRASDLLARMGEAPLRFHPEAPLGRFDFAANELAVVEVIRAKPQPLAELRARGLAEPAELDRIVYALSALRHLETGASGRPIGVERASGSMPVPAVWVDSARPPSISTPSPAAAPAVPLVRPAASLAPPAPGQGDAFRRELAERAAETKQSYYQVLGVADDAAPEVIAAAFFQLAKRYHPDRLGPDFDDVRELATRVFARMTEAHQILSDPERKGQYDELHAQGQGAAEEHEQVQRIVRAATCFQKAQVLLKRNNLQAAEEEARQALADDPEQADHVALVAWLEAGKPGADLPASLRVLNRAVEMENANVRVRWYRGQLLKRMGQERRAVEDFRYVVERDPRHVDALREIRLHEMQRGASKRGETQSSERMSDPARPRRPGSDPPGGKPGFFGKLFKR